MEPTDRPRLGASAPADLALASGPAVRDAAAIVARAAEDEAAADAARERYRTSPMPVLEPDAGLAPLLHADEQLLAVRRSALVDRRAPAPGLTQLTGVAGDLFLTSQRLLLVGRTLLSLDLADIDEAMLAGDRLLLVMRNGDGVSLGVASPRLLRVEIATARAANRA